MLTVTLSKVLSLLCHHLRPPQPHRQLGRIQRLQLHRHLLRPSPLRPPPHRRRWHRPQPQRHRRLPPRGARPPNRSRPLPHQLQPLLRHHPPQVRLPPPPLRARSQQQPLHRQVPGHRPPPPFPQVPRSPVQRIRGNHPQGPLRQGSRCHLHQPQPHRHRNQNSSSSSTMAGPRKKKEGWKPSQDGEDTIGILCIEVTNAMSQAVNLYRSLSNSEIARLRSQTLASPAVRLLVSTNEPYLLALALAEKLGDLNRVAAVASCLGRRCSHPALLGFEHVYSDLLAGRIDPAGLGSLSTEPHRHHTSDLVPPVPPAHAAKKGTLVPALPYKLPRVRANPFCLGERRNRETNSLASSRIQTHCFLPIEPFDGTNHFRRWQGSILLRLRTLGIAYVLFDRRPSSADAAEQWDDDDALYRGHILHAQAMAFCEQAKADPSALLRLCLDGLHRSPLVPVQFWCLQALHDAILLRYSSLSPADLTPLRFFSWDRSRPCYRPSAAEFDALLLPLARARLWPHLWSLAADMRALSLPLSPDSFAAIIDAYGRAALPDLAVEVFNRLRRFSCPQTIPVYNALLSALCRAGNFHGAYALLRRMARKNVPPRPPDTAD